MLDKNKLIVFFVFFISFTFIYEINSVFSSDKEILKFKDSIKLLKEKKFPEAISSLKTISDDNNLKAQHMLSQILYSGNITTQDFEKSYYWANIAKLGGYKKSEKIVGTATSPDHYEELTITLEKEIIEDLIVAAHNDAKSKLKKKTTEEISKVTGGIELPPGFKLPF